MIAVKAMGERKTSGKRGDRRTEAGCREGARLCLTLVTMGHFLAFQARLGPRWISSRFLTRGDAPGQLKRR